MSECIFNSNHTEPTTLGSEDQPLQKGISSAHQVGVGLTATYVLKLCSRVQAEDVARLMRYVSDFGTGAVRGHAHGDGWCLRLSRLSDLRIVSLQCGDLIEGHYVEYSEGENVG